MAQTEIIAQPFKYAGHFVVQAEADNHLRSFNE